MNDQLLTINQLSNYLQITVRTLHNHKKLPDFPIIKIGNTIRFNRQAVLQWYKQNDRENYFRVKQYRGLDKYEDYEFE